MDSVQQQIQDGIKSYLTQNQYGVSPIAAHTHNGSDSLQVDNKDILNKTPVAQNSSPAVGTTLILDMFTSNLQFIQMPAGNITLSLMNDIKNQVFIISITQDSVGSRTVAWFGGISWAGGSAPTLTTTGSKTDTFGFIRTGISAYNGYIVGQNI